VIGSHGLTCLLMIQSDWLVWSFSNRLRIACDKVSCHSLPFSFCISSCSHYSSGYCMILLQWYARLCKPLLPSVAQGVFLEVISWFCPLSFWSKGFRIETSVTVVFCMCLKMDPVLQCHLQPFLTFSCGVQFPVTIFSSLWSAVSVLVSLPLFFPIILLQQIFSLHRFFFMISFRVSFLCFSIYTCVI